MRLRRHYDNVKEYSLVCLKIRHAAPSKTDSITRGGVGNNEDEKMSNVPSLAQLDA